MLPFVAHGIDHVFQLVAFPPTAGEILTVLTLASLAYPVALAAQAPLRAAVTCAAAFVAVFVAATVPVRAVIMYTRRPPAALSRIVGGLALVVGILGLAALSQLGLAVGVWAAVPVCSVGFVLVLAPPSATRLRLVGWTLIAATAATAIVLVAGLRLSR